MASSRWYGEGLSFACTQCGDCCTGAPGYVWVNESERKALANFLRLDLAAFARQYVRRARGRYSLVEKRNGDCIFYDRGCTVYPVRPKQCRTFPFWPENLRSRADWDRVGCECPGVDRGRLYPLEHIELMRKGDLDASASAGQTAEP